MSDNSPLESELTQVAQVGEILDVELLLVIVEGLLDVHIDVVNIVEVVR